MPLTYQKLYLLKEDESPGMEALMILLRRFAYPNRWCDLVSLFGRSTVSAMNTCFCSCSTGSHLNITDIFKHIDMAGSY